MQTRDISHIPANQYLQANRYFTRIAGRVPANVASRLLENFGYSRKTVESIFLWLDHQRNNYKFREQFSDLIVVAKDKSAQSVFEVMTGITPEQIGELEKTTREISTVRYMFDSEIYEKRIKPTFDALTRELAFLKVSIDNGIIPLNYDSYHVYNSIVDKINTIHNVYSNCLRKKEESFVCETVKSIWFGGLEMPINTFISLLKNQTLDGLSQGTLNEFVAGVESYLKEELESSKCKLIHSILVGINEMKKRGKDTNLQSLLGTYNETKEEQMKPDQRRMQLEEKLKTSPKYLRSKTGFSSAKGRPIDDEYLFKILTSEKIITLTSNNSSFNSEVDKLEDPLRKRSLKMVIALISRQLEFLRASVIYNISSPYYDLIDIYNEAVAQLNLIRGEILEMRSEQKLNIAEPISSIKIGEMDYNLKLFAGLLREQGGQDEQGLNLEAIKKLAKTIDQYLLNDLTPSAQFLVHKLLSELNNSSGISLKDLADAYESTEKSIPEIRKQLKDQLAGVVRKKSEYLPIMPEKLTIYSMLDKSDQFQPFLIDESTLFFENEIEAINKVMDESIIPYSRGESGKLAELKIELMKRGKNRGFFNTLNELVNYLMGLQQQLRAGIPTEEKSNFRRKLKILLSHLKAGASIAKAKIDQETGKEEALYYAVGEAPIIPTEEASEKEPEAIVSAAPESEELPKPESIDVARAVMIEKERLAQTAVSVKPPAPKAPPAEEIREEREYDPYKLYVKIIEESLTGILGRYQTAVKEATEVLFVENIQGLDEFLQELFDKSFKAKSEPPEKAYQPILEMVNQILILGSIVGLDGSNSANHLTAVNYDLGELGYYPLEITLKGRKVRKDNFLEFGKDADIVLKVLCFEDYLRSADNHFMVKDKFFTGFKPEHAVLRKYSERIRGILGNASGSGSYSAGVSDEKVNRNLVAAGYRENTKTLIFTKYLKSCEWFENYEIKSEETKKRVSELLNEARFCAQLLEEGSKEKIEYHITSPKIHSKAIEEILSCFPEKYRPQIKIIRYREIGAFDDRELVYPVQNQSNPSAENMPKNENSLNNQKRQKTQKFSDVWHWAGRQIRVKLGRNCTVDSVHAELRQTQILALFEFLLKNKNLLDAAEELDRLYEQYLRGSSANKLAKNIINELVPIIKAIMRSAS